MKPSGWALLSGGIAKSQKQKPRRYGRVWCDGASWALLKGINSTRRSRDGAIKDHPCLRHELQARQFVVRTLEKLGITYETVKSGGRPPAGIGWRGPDAD